MTPELKPCPFCGGEPFVYISGNKSYGYFKEVICPQCHCQTHRLRGEEAVEVWNRRVGDDLMERMVDDGN